MAAMDELCMILESKKVLLEESLSWFSEFSAMRERNVGLMQTGQNFSSQLLYSNLQNLVQEGTLNIRCAVCCEHVLVMYDGIKILMPYASDVSIVRNPDAGECG